MLKVFLFLLPGILLAQNNWKDFSLKGKVKSLGSVTVKADNYQLTSTSGFLDSENFDSVYLEFDSKGNLILQKNFLDYQGKLGLFDWTKFQFNHENQIEKSETTLIQNGEEPRKTSQRKTFYYIKNQLVRMDEFNAGRTSDQFWVTNYIYDGGRLKRKDFWMEDEIFSTSEFEHRLMKVTSEKTFHNDGKLGKTIIYKYDDNAKLILKSAKSGNEQTDETFEYENAKLKAHTIKNRGKIILEEFLTMDELPKEIRKFNYATQEFDLYQFQFQYDNQNNWINCVILMNQTPKLIIKRKIDYY